MRRQGQYSDSNMDPYSAARVHRVSGHRMEHKHKPNPFQGRLEAFTPEREQSYASSETDQRQWRWEIDESKMSNPVPSHMFDEGQGGDVSRSYYQNQRADPKLGMDKGSNSDPRSQTHGEDIEIRRGGDQMLIPQSFEGLQQKFLNDILKLAKEQNDAEDSENTRHREKINAINAQYEEQLTALRARHAGHRDELLQKESQARHHQYQKAIMSNNPYPNNTMVDPNDPYRFSGGMAANAVGEPQTGYDSSDQYESYRDRARFLGSRPTGGHGLEQPRGAAFPGSRVYDTRNHQFY